MASRFPHKRTKQVSMSLRANSIDGLVEGMPLVFQREQAKDLSATYHFTFTGAESRQITVTIRDRRLDIAEGHEGEPDLRVTADSATWLRFLTKPSVLPWALLFALLLFLWRTGPMARVRGWFAGRSKAPTPPAT